jgi:hypothetical protein
LREKRLIAKPNKPEVGVIGEERLALKLEP